MIVGSQHSADVQTSQDRTWSTNPLFSLASYVIVFVLGALPWLAQAHRARPVGVLGNRRDEYLIEWALAWVARALVADPSSVYDAPINYPAPLQLTGTEHFLSSQLLFAPVYWLTDNATLATNLTVFATYPLSALAMQRLLLAMGGAPGVAWVTGLAYAVMPSQANAHFHQLQYLNLFLPLTALALCRLRSDPGFRAAGLLAVALALGLLSSYYTAVFVLLTGGIWWAFELARSARGRFRYMTLAFGATSLALVAFLAFSLPYLMRPEVGFEPPGLGELTKRGKHHLFFLLLAINAAPKSVLGGWFCALAPVGILSLWSADLVTRRWALRGLVLALVALSLMPGPVIELGGRQVPLPLALFPDSPLRFFRYPIRFAVIMYFGTTLLCAAALQAGWSRLGRRFGSLMVAGVAAVVFVDSVGQIPGKEQRVLPEQHLPIYEHVKQAAREHGQGPLLELPASRNAMARSLLGQTRHQVPLVLGHTGYQPAHRPTIEKAVEQLPAKQALDFLVGATRVRWILLRPKGEWARPNRRTRLLGLPGTTHTLSQDGFDLLRVDLPVPERDSYRAIKRGYRHGETALGTPIKPLPEERAVARVRGKIPNTLKAGTAHPIMVHIVNAEDAPWPVAFPRWSKPAYGVVAVVRWWRAGHPTRSGKPVLDAQWKLPWDVEPGMELTLLRPLEVPREPGIYDLEIGVRQVGGARFTDRRNQPLRKRTEVLAH